MKILKFFLYFFSRSFFSPKKSTISVFYFLFFCSFFVRANDEAFVQKELSHLDLRSGRAFDCFLQAQKKGELAAYESMAEIFADSCVSYHQMLESIRADMRHCRLHMRKEVLLKHEYQALLAKLKEFYRYVREHEECCKAIHFHQELQQRYALAFDNLDIVQSLQLTPELYGVSKHKNKCKTYYKRVLKDLQKVEKFEDTLHGNFSVLKAYNYDYKIELIKIRNQIYHHNRYKFETRFF